MLPPRSAGCNVLRQWDLARAVPRHVRDVPLVKGDILGIATRPGAVFTCGADGSIRCAPAHRPFFGALLAEVAVRVHALPDHESAAALPSAVARLIAITPAPSVLAMNAHLVALSPHMEVTAGGQNSHFRWVWKPWLGTQA